MTTIMLCTRNQYAISMNICSNWSKTILAGNPIVLVVMVIGGYIGLGATICEAARKQKAPARPSTPYTTSTFNFRTPLLSTMFSFANHLMCRWVPRLLALLPLLPSVA